MIAYGTPAIVDIQLTRSEAEWLKDLIGNSEREVDSARRKYQQELYEKLDSILLL